MKPGLETFFITVLTNSWKPGFGGGGRVFGGRGKSQRGGSDGGVVLPRIDNSWKSSGGGGNKDVVSRMRSRKTLHSTYVPIVTLM